MCAELLGRPTDVPLWCALCLASWGQKTYLSDDDALGMDFSLHVASSSRRFRLATEKRQTGGDLIRATPKKESSFRGND